VCVRNTERERERKKSEACVWGGEEEVEEGQGEGERWRDVSPFIQRIGKPGSHLMQERRRSTTTPVRRRIAVDI
jgi:hypothetical protein